MITTLANLLNGNEDLLGGISKNFHSGGYFSGVLLVGLLLILAHLVGLLFWIKWRKQVAARPDGNGLLARAAETLDLETRDRRLLSRLGREVGFEPTAALVSAAMLELLVARWSEKFGQLPDDDAQRIDRIRKTVRAACG